MHLFSYFGDFGKLEGHISDTAAGSFLLELAMTTSLGEKFANQALPAGQEAESSRGLRIQNRRAHHPAKLAFDPDLRRRLNPQLFIIDMSASGAAVSADPQPQIGVPLAVGACVGGVVRILPHGFAIKFVEQQHRNDLERLVVRPRTCAVRQRRGTTRATRRLTRAYDRAPRPTRTSQSAAQGYQTIGISRYLTLSWYAT